MTLPGEALTTRVAAGEPPMPHPVSAAQAMTPRIRHDFGKLANLGFHPFPVAAYGSCHS
jgi:hypothetical protein